MEGSHELRRRQRQRELVDWARQCRLGQFDAGRIQSDWVEIRNLTFLHPDTAWSDTRLVSVFALETGETADEDGRWLFHLVARCSIDLDRLDRPVPLRLVSDLTRRAAVATLLKLQSMAASPSGPTWPGAAFAPDRTALVSWLSVRWPHDIAPEVRATFGPTFRDSGLGTPWIPERVGSLTLERDWWWSGRATPETQVLRPQDAYMFGPALDRLARDWRQRFHLSHFGHGVNSYSINYEFVGSRVSLVAQAAWGGIYMDVDHAVSGVRALSSDLQLLEQLADSIADWPSQRGRLLVCASNFRGARGWRWLGEPAENWRALTEPTAEEEEAAGDMDDLDTGIGPAIRLLEAMLADELGILEDTTDYSATFGG